MYPPNMSLCIYVYYTCIRVRVRYTQFLTQATSRGGSHPLPALPRAGHVEEALRT